MPRLPLANLVLITGLPPRDTDGGRVWRCCIFSAVKVGLKTAEIYCNPNEAD